MPTQVTINIATPEKKHQFGVLEALKTRNAALLQEDENATLYPETMAGAKTYLEDVLIASMDGWAKQFADTQLQEQARTAWRDASDAQKAAAIAALSS